MSAAPWRPRATAAPRCWPGGSHVVADQARQQADTLLTPRATLITDLPRLGLADGSALRFLLFTRRETDARDATLRLFGVRPWVRERLSLGDVLHLFDIDAEMATAPQPAHPEAAGPCEN